MQHSILHCQNPVDFVRIISALESTEQVTKHFSEIVACYGGIHVLIRRFQRPHESLAECVLMDTRPKVWARRHRNQNYTNIDPLVQVAQKRSTPCSWSEAMSGFPMDSIEQQIHAERLTFGVADGLLVPIHANNGYGGLVSISATAAFAEQASNVLTLMALKVHNLLSALERSDPGDLVGFTERGFECLSWAAAGKSDAEIAAILQISRKTVNYHMEGAKRSMKATTRTHAVANAFRRGLID